MRPTPPPKRHLAVEPLEDRCNPTTGVPWLDSASLTLSFVPDGTDISGAPSSTFGLLGAAPPAAWQREVVRAFQTWAAQANVNVGVVPDNGQPMGVTGAPQEDARFGDIRVGARPLSAAFADSLAGSTGFSHAGGTWSGDVVLNSKYRFGAGATATQNDLFSVVLHEAGNSLGLADNYADKAAVMYPRYQGQAAGLGAADVAAVRRLYGARAADRYEGAAGNGTPETAYNLSPLVGAPVTALTGDVTQAGDVDVFRFVTPAFGDGDGTRLTVDLKAAGLSLFTGRVTVLDAAHKVVGTAAATDPLANDLAVPVPSLRPNAAYFVRVEGAGADVFSVGAYNLHLSYNRAFGASAVTAAAPYMNYEGWLGNAVQAAAEPLAPLSAGNQSTFAVGGLLTSAADVDWFRFTPAAAAAGTLTVSVWAFSGDSVRPAVAVYDALGNKLPAEVVANDNGLFTVQVPNRGPGATYFARVAAADPAGTRAVGLYTLGTNLGNHPPTLYDALEAGTLTAAERVKYSGLTVGEARLTQFALTATTAAGAPAAVRMSIFDAAGRRVFTLVARAGDPAATGAVWLPAGTYTVAYNAATQSGAPLPGVAFGVKKWERSNPVDPLPADPTDPPPPPPPGGVVVVTPLPPPVPPPPVDDPYANT